MSEFTKKTEETIPVLVSPEEARQLVEWAESSTLGTKVTRIYKQGRFAYYTNNHVVVRWDVKGLDVPDGSWIELIPECGGEPDTLRNMGDWSQVADRYDRWDLMDTERWSEPDEWPVQDCENLFTRARAVVPFVAFFPPQLTGLCRVVTGHEYGPVALAPTREDGSGPWWVMGRDRRVAGLCMQFRDYFSSEDEMPEAYQEKKEEGQQ